MYDKDNICWEFCCVCCFIKFYRRVIIFWQNKMWGISFLSCIQLEEYECVTV